MRSLAIGVDVGGSHISCAACDLSKKNYLPETYSENPLDNQGTLDEIMAVWSQTIGQTIRKTGVENIAGIGFAMPGPFDYANGIALFKGDVKKYESLYGHNISYILKEELDLPNDFPVRYINDATAFALGEDWLGKASGFNRSLSITLGTGFGSAFLKNHRPVVSGDEVPATGAVWHLPFGDGNADDYFSTRGLLNRYQIRTRQELSGVKELAALASSDETARELFVDFGYKMGVFLKPWIEKSGTEILVIGGNISHAFSLFGKHLQDYFAENDLHIPIEVSELKETASMIGSAILADDFYYQQIRPLLSEM